DPTAGASPAPTDPTGEPQDEVDPNCGKAARTGSAVAVAAAFSTAVVTLAAGYVRGGAARTRAGKRKRPPHPEGAAAARPPSARPTSPGAPVPPWQDASLAPLPPARPAVEVFTQVLQAGRTAVEAAEAVRDQARLVRRAAYEAAA